MFESLPFRHMSVMNDVRHAFLLFRKVVADVFCYFIPNFFNNMQKCVYVKVREEQKCFLLNVES